VKNYTDLIALLLDTLRGRAGRWDAAKDAFKSEDPVVRRTAVILPAGAHAAVVRAYFRGHPVTGRQAAADAPPPIHLPSRRTGAPSVTA
jgi:hypothetical protein